MGKLGKLSLFLYYLATLLVLISLIPDGLCSGYGGGGCRIVHQTVHGIVKEGSQGHLCRKAFKKSCSKGHKNVLGTSKKHIECSSDHRTSVCDTDVGAQFVEKCTNVYKQRCSWGRQNIGAAKWETRCKLHAGPWGKAICREVPRGGVSKEATRCQLVPQRVCRHVALKNPHKTCYSVAKARCGFKGSGNTKKYSLSSINCMPRAQRLCKKVTKTVPRKKSYQVAKAICDGW